jgi:E1A-binding protein p400
MISTVKSTVSIDNDDTSPTSACKRRRSSMISFNDNSHEQSPLKRVRSTTTSNLQSMFSSLNDIVQSHRNLVREYLDLQMGDRTDLSIDEQRFIQAEEDLIRKVERNLQEMNSSWISTDKSTPVAIDRVKYESEILKRIDDFKSQGKWSNQRLVKFIEPKKRKTHWDYLLDEMRWLAEDFAHEKRWKQMMSKKISLAILRYFREKNQAETQQQRDEIKRLRKHALFVCKEVMTFWKNMHKIAEYKETTRIQELRKHQLDLHLNFIVDQTEQYSDWLVKSLKNSTDNKNDDDDDDDDDNDDDNDDEFSIANENNDDDEETIEREEQDEQDEYARNEIEELAADQEESVDALLKRYYGIELSNSSSEKENNQPKDMKSDRTSREHRDDESKEMNQLATTAQALQPTGFTLNTTEVKTPVPFLLKHSLREYQHVGLDWLVTLYENKLNCILADEMGLGKTIQTIALLAHLACEQGVWGPHLIVVPTSVMLNWELEFKKWCPAFKILTYYGSVKERQLKRQGWTKVNAFHVCITSYKLVLQDAKAFRRKKWKYLILDEAQNIKNFKSQRWQTLLNFHSQRRLLLTGTPLQNSLMELWSLMHFLMPNLFASHQEFREWFSNPLSEMIEQGQMNSNDMLIKRLHKVLRPFILRRLKIDVEKQMPKKHEHVIMCQLSKRQRQLYDDFIQCQSTRDVIYQGHYMSVINILMQLRKVCNHPDLFESRPIVSPLTLPPRMFTYEIPKLLEPMNLKNPYLALNSPPNDTFLCFRIKFTLQATKQMIFDQIDQIDDDDQRMILPLTSDLIERYRTSSIWYQANGLTSSIDHLFDINCSIIFINMLFS